MSSQSITRTDEVDDLKKQLMDKHLSPDNFDEFLPWACRQLPVDAEVIIIRVVTTPYVSPNTLQSKKKKPSPSIVSKSEITVVDNMESVSINSCNLQDMVKIYAVYDNAGDLLELKFDKNKKIPRLLLKIISLVLQYHTTLTRITINKGLNNVLLHELNNLLKISKINHLCLDNTLISDANYDILLENESHLNNLSLSRCLINDSIIKRIASKLSYPLPASKTLSILNLSSNKITDIGAKYLADALRSNRSLLYLNLSDNLIADDGAIAILDVLQEFPLSKEEATDSKTSYVANVKRKLEMRAAYDEPVSDGKRNMKRKSVKPCQLKTSKIPEKESLMAMALEDDYSKDPFSHSYIRCSTDHTLYCYGNNYLACLNLSYNSIGYFTLKRLLNVLTYQSMFDRQPRGLVRLGIEGNSIPENCEELIQINDILQTIANVHTKNTGALSKKKTRSKMFLK